MTNTPAPRVGDVIIVAAGACTEYRATFRLRVDEIITRSGTVALDKVIMGGAVVKADGQLRVDSRGRSVERAITVTDASKLTVITPAPATYAEIDAAWAEHTRREIERTQCDHAAGTPGCTHVWCEGIPPVAGAVHHARTLSSVAMPGETGHVEFVRMIAQEIGAYPHMSITGDLGTAERDPYMGGGGRGYGVATYPVNGHTVHVTSYDSPTMYRYAVTVDGTPVTGDALDSRPAATSGNAARMIAWHVAEALRNAAQVEPESVAQVDAPAEPAQVEPERGAQVDVPAPAAPVAQVDTDRAERIARLQRAGVESTRDARGTTLSGVTVTDLPDGRIVVTCAGLALDTVSEVMGAPYRVEGRTIARGVSLVTYAPVTVSVPRTAESEAPMSDASATIAPVPVLPCGCPIANVDTAGPLGHRAECTHHVEPAQVEPERVDLGDTVRALLASVGTAQVEPEPVAQVEPTGRLSVTVERDALVSALDVAYWAAPSRPSVPVLSGVLLTAGPDGLTVATFDYETSARYALPADVATAGRALVAVRGLRDMVRKLPRVKARRGEQLPTGAGRVTLTDTGTALTVTCGPVRLSLPTMPVEDYPTLPEPCAPVARVDGRLFAATVARVSVAAGRDGTLPALTGVHVTVDRNGRALLAATDRYRVAFDSLAWGPIVPDGVDPREAISPALIPAATLAHVAKLAGKLGAVVTVGYTMSPQSRGRASVTLAESASFTFGPVTVTTRALDSADTFPPVRKLLPDAYAGTAQVDAHALADAVGRVMLVAEKTTPVRLTWAGDTVTVAAGSTDGAEASEPVGCTADTADGFTIAFNAVFLVDALRAFPAGTVVRFGFTDDKKPAVIDATDTDAPAYQHVIMPIRIGGNAGSDPAPATPAGPVEPSADVPAEPVAQVEPEPVAEPAQVDATPAEPVEGKPESDATDPAREAPTVPTATLRKVRSALSAQGFTGHAVRNPWGDVITIKNARLDPDTLSRIVGRPYVAGDTRTHGFGGMWTTYRPTDAPAQVDATAPADVPAGTVHEPTERAAHVAYEAMTAGRFTDARAALTDVRAVAPAGYRVAGRFTVDTLAEMIDAAERAATPAEPEPVAQVEPAPTVTVREWMTRAHTSAEPVDVPAEPVAQVDATAALTLADMPPAPALTSADAAALAVAERAAVAAIVARPHPVGSTVESVHADPFPVRGVVAGYPEPGRVSIGWHGGNTQTMPVDAVRPVPAEPVAAPTVAAPVAQVAAPVAVPSGPLTYTLAAYSAEVGMSYRASRSALRDAFKAAGVRASVDIIDGNRRGFTVPCAPADRERVAAIVAATVRATLVTEPASL